MKHIQLFESFNNEKEIVVGSVVRMKEPPSPRLDGVDFIVKVDLGYEVIMFQVQPGLTDEEIQILTDTPHYASGPLGEEVKKTWQSLPYLKGDPIPIRTQKHRLIKIK